MTERASSLSIAQIAGGVEATRPATPDANGEFAELLAAHTQHQNGAAPAGLAQVCRDELKNAGHESLSELATGEMTSPAEPGPMLLEKPDNADLPRRLGNGVRDNPNQPPPGEPRQKPSAGAPAPGHGAARSSSPPKAAETSAQSSTTPPRNQPTEAHPLRSLEQAGPAPAGSATRAADGSQQVNRGTASGRVDALAAGERGLARSRALPAALTSKSAKPPVFHLEREQFASQVSRSLANVLARGGGKLTLRLSPQALGDVRVDLHVHQGAASASFRAGSESARELLKSRIDDLRHALEQRGVRVERLEVVGPHSESAEPSTQWGGQAGKEPSTDAHDQHGASNRRSAARSHGAPAEAGGDSPHELAAEPGSGSVSSVMVHRTGDGVVLRLDAVA